jgi:hypothetical protein
MPFTCKQGEQIIGVEIQKPLIEGADWSVKYVVVADGRRRNVVGKAPSYFEALEQVAVKASKMGIGEAIE